MTPSHWALPAFAAGCCVGVVLDAIIRNYAGREKNARIKLLAAALSGLVCALCVLRFGVSPQALTASLCGMVFICVSFTDAQTLKIPNVFIAALLPPCALAVFTFPDVSLLQRIIGFFMISVPFLAFALIRPGSIGGGDIKLMAVCGFLLGYRLALVSLYFAVICVLPYAFILLLAKKSLKTRFSFGPFLCFGVFAALLYGEAAIRLYLNLALHAVP